MLGFQASFFCVVVVVVAVYFATPFLYGFGGVVNRTECAKNQEIIDYASVCGNELTMTVRLRMIPMVVNAATYLQRAREIFWKNCEDTCPRNNFFAILNVSVGEYLNLTTATKDHSLRAIHNSDASFALPPSFSDDFRFIPMYESVDSTPAVLFQERLTHDVGGTSLINCHIQFREPTYKTIQYACVSLNTSLTFVWIRKVNCDGIGEQMASEYTSYKLKIPPLFCD